VVGVANVVEQDHRAPVSEHSAVEGGLRVRVGGDARRRQTNGREESVKSVRRANRGAARVEAAQGDVELAIGKPVADPVGPVHRERGLLQSGRAHRAMGGSFIAGAGSRPAAFSLVDTASSNH
jgi:hypothetical protein